MSGPIEITQAAWGEDAPKWIMELAEKCAATSANRVARKLGRSGAMISQALNNSYPASLAPLEERFNGVFKNLEIECPQLGPISPIECGDWREKSKEFVPVSQERAKMFRACNNCPRNKKGSS